ncbi:hypothetical protein ACHAQA_002557 [Verticillium albo-atrum]
MALLVGYSSDEEEEEEELAQVEPVENNTTAAPSNPTEPERKQSAAPEESPPPPPGPQPALQEPSIGPIQQHSVPLGPSLPEADNPYLPEPDVSGPSGASPAPSSPYTASRALLRDLTLPPTPNLDIPPSPPGSPPPALTAKAQQFLDLKKRGLHFNAKLTTSAALRNPALMDKLLAFVELDADARAQYDTTLPPDAWDPSAAAGAGGFPDWAFRGPLRLSQERVRKEREAEKTGGKRTAVEFVAGGGTPGSGSDTGGLRGSKRKAGAW